MKLKEVKIEKLLEEEIEQELPTKEIKVEKFDSIIENN